MNKIPCYRVFAPGGTYYSLSPADNATQEKVLLLLPPWLQFVPAAADDKEPIFKIGAEITIPASCMKTITRKSCAIPYIQTPYGIRDIVLHVQRIENTIE